MSEDSYQRTLKKVARESGLVFLSRVGGYFLGFLLHFLLARLLGPSGYGLYSIGFNVATFGSLVAVFGLNAAAVRFIGEFMGKKEHSRVRGVAESVLRFSLLFASLLAIGIYLFRVPVALSLFKEERLLRILPIFCFFIPALALESAFEGIFRGFKLPSFYYFNREILGRILEIGCAAGFFFLWSAKVFGVSLGILFANFLILFLLARTFLKILPPAAPDFPKRALFSYSSNMFLVNFTYFLTGQVNGLIVGAFLGANAAGLYSISNRLSQLIVFFLTAFNSVFASVISEFYHRGDIEDLKKLYSSVTRWIVSLTLPFFLWMVVYSSDLLRFFGEEYVQASSVFVVLSVGQLINALVGPNGLMLSMSKFQKIELLNGALMTVLNLGLSFLLIDKVGILGPALGGGLAVATLNILKSFEVYWFLKINPYHRGFLKPVLGGLVVALFMYFFHFLGLSGFWIVIPLLGGFLLMGGMLYLLGLFEEDRMLFKTLKKRFFG